jgi:predicted NBD/HSP70 family sugar kinase
MQIALTNLVRVVLVVGACVIGGVLVVARAGSVAGVGVVIVMPGSSRSSQTDLRSAGRSLDAAPLADRLRNELDIATIVEDAAAYFEAAWRLCQTVFDLADAAIAAQRKGEAS